MIAAAMPSEEPAAASTAAAAPSRNQEPCAFIASVEANPGIGPCSTTGSLGTRKQKRAEKKKKARSEWRKALALHRIQLGSQDPTPEEIQKEAEESKKRAEEALRWELKEKEYEHQNRIRAAKEEQERLKREKRMQIEAAWKSALESIRIASSKQAESKSHHQTSTPPSVKVGRHDVRSSPSPVQQTNASVPPGDAPLTSPADDPPSKAATSSQPAACMFHQRTGNCRFGRKCNRTHNTPLVSRFILVRDLFLSDLLPELGYDSSIGQGSRDQEAELKAQYDDFFRDAYPEFRRLGPIVVMKVCRNQLPHFRGCAYVEYQHEADACQAFTTMNGRFYNGRRLTCEFLPHIDWWQAECHAFQRNQCPHGGKCNYLHVFRNPRLSEAEPQGLRRANEASDHSSSRHKESSSPRPDRPSKRAHYHLPRRHSREEIRPPRRLQSRRR